MVTKHYLEYNDVILTVDDWSSFLRLDKEEFLECLGACSFDLEKAIQNLYNKTLVKLRRV